MPDMVPISKLPSRQGVMYWYAVGSSTWECFKCQKKERERKWHTADAYASWALHAVRILIILPKLGGRVTTNVTS